MFVFLKEHLSAIECKRFKRLSPVPLHTLGSCISLLLPLWYKIRALSEDGQNIAFIRLRSDAHLYTRSKAGFNRSRRVPQNHNFGHELGVDEHLGFLRIAAAGSFDDFLDLEPHLSKCAKVCSDFFDLVSKYSLGTNGKRAVAVSWTKLQFEKPQISSLKSSLSRTKSTISLTLGGINMYVLSCL